MQSHFLMPNTDLQQVFASSFYIDRQYAQSFAPLMVQFLNGKMDLKPETNEDRATRLQNLQSDSSVLGSESYVAVVSIKQPILKFDTYSYFGTKTYQKILNRLAADPDVLGVVLDIDSGGGTSYGTPEFYDYILNFSKPIAAYTDGYMCSAAYYIGNPCNYIVANKRAEYIGSIGAYTSQIDITGILEKWGAKIHTVYATDSTEKNYEGREFEKGNYEPYIKNILDPLVKTFQADMKAARPNLNDKVFKGGAWDAEKALEYGLIDEIGTLETAVLKVIELSQKNTNSNLNTDMSKENSFPKLATVLGIENVEAKKPHIFAASETVSLSVEQLTAIEAALTEPGDGQKLTTLQSELDAANAAKKVAEENNAAVLGAVNTALEAAGLQADKKATTVENIGLMSEKLLDYGAKPGADVTNVHATGDPTQEGNEQSTQIFDSLVK